MPDIDITQIPPNLIQIVLTGLVLGGLILANRLPTFFGFLAWQFGVVEREDEVQSDYYRRASFFWFKMSLYWSVILWFIIQYVPIEEGSIVGAIIYIVCPILLVVGFLRSAADFIRGRYYGRHEI